MATPRTGSPRGRRPKAKEITPKRLRGRPVERLANDPDRYLLAVIQAHIQLFKFGELEGRSENRVVNLFVSLRFGEPEATPENLEAMKIGMPFRVVKEKWLCGGEKDSEAYRDRNVFNPPTDNVSRKLRRIRTRPPNHPDRWWLAAMVLAWEPCLKGERDRIVEASLWASHAGETAYFYACMLPVMIDRSRQRDAGVESMETRLPEFRAIFFRTT
jgi:hypothetical protein